jgi:hypothetical protein
LSNNPKQQSAERNLQLKFGSVGSQSWVCITQGSDGAKYKTVPLTLKTIASYRYTLR